MSLTLDQVKKLSRVELARLYLDSMKQEALLREVKDKTSELVLITGEMQYVLKGDPRKLLELLMSLLSNYCTHTGLSFKALLNSVTQEIEKWEQLNESAQVH